MSAARDEILARVRAAKGGSAAPVPAPREYRRSDPRPRHELIELFCERTDDYRAEVQRVAAGGLGAAIGAAAARHGARRLAIPAALPDAWRPAGLELVTDTGLTARELDGVDGVISGCTVAIAETGTIALSAGPHEGRRILSLVPDLHICVVAEQQIVATVPEAIARLGELARTQRRALTLISGPSATSDIELQRVEGVHGPRRLVVLVTAGSA